MELKRSLFIFKDLYLSYLKFECKVEGIQDLFNALVRAFNFARVIASDTKVSA